MSVETEQEAADRPTPQRPSPTLGVTAVVVAGVSATALQLIVLPWVYVPSLPAPPDPTGLGWPVFLQAIGTVAAIVLALIALATGRGRWWAVAAIIVAVLGSVYFRIVLSMLFPEPGKGG